MRKGRQRQERQRLGDRNRLRQEREGTDGRGRGRVEKEVQETNGGGQAGGRAAGEWVTRGAKGAVTLGLDPSLLDALVVEPT